MHVCGRTGRICDWSPCCVHVSHNIKHFALKLINVYESEEERERERERESSSAKHSFISSTFSRIESGAYYMYLYTRQKKKTQTGIDAV